MASKWVIPKDARKESGGTPEKAERTEKKGTLGFWGSGVNPGLDVVIISRTP